MHITSNLEAADEQRNRLNDTPVSKQQETEAIVQKDSTYWTTEDRKMSLDVIWMVVSDNMLLQHNYNAKILLSSKHAGSFS